MWSGDLQANEKRCPLPCVYRKQNDQVGLILTVNYKKKSSHPMKLKVVFPENYHLWNILKLKTMKNLIIWLLTSFLISQA